MMIRIRVSIPKWAKKESGVASVGLWTSLCSIRRLCVREEDLYLNCGFGTWKFRVILPEFSHKHGVCTRFRDKFMWLDRVNDFLMLYIPFVFWLAYSWTSTAGVWMVGASSLVGQVVGRRLSHGTGLLVSQWGAPWDPRSRQALGLSGAFLGDDPFQPGAPIVQQERQLGCRTRGLLHIDVVMFFSDSNKGLGKTERPGHTFQVKLGNRFWRFWVTLPVLPWSDPNRRYWGCLQYLPDTPFLDLLVMCCCRSSL